jgi:hypothetical protein
MRRGREEDRMPISEAEVSPKRGREVGGVIM